MKNVPEKGFVRTEMLLGTAAMERLGHAHVAIFGIGGVGGYAAEALARVGVGELSLFDHDVVSESNLNRQIIALHSTLGRHKVEVMRQRIADINPAATVHAHVVFFDAERADDARLADYDYIVDAIDTVPAKVALIVGAAHSGTPIISCMGAGNKLDPARFEVADIYETQECPLARVLRKELRARGVDALRVVYSREPAHTPQPQDGRRITASVSFVPPVAGFIAAGVVVRALARGEDGHA